MKMMKISLSIYRKKIIYEFRKMSHDQFWLGLKKQMSHDPFYDWLIEKKWVTIYCDWLIENIKWDGECENVMCTCDLTK